MIGIGKGLVFLGGVLVAVGLLLIFFEKIPFLGKLPGDIHIKKDNVDFYFPVVTSIVLSLVLSLIVWLVNYLAKK